MVTLPARAQRAFTRRALTALACIGALALSSCSAQPQADDSETAPMMVATSSAPLMQRPCSPRRMAPGSRILCRSLPAWIPR